MKRNQVPKFKKGDRIVHLDKPDLKSTILGVDTGDLWGYSWAGFEGWGEMKHIRNIDIDYIDEVFKLDQDGLERILEKL